MEREFFGAAAREEALDARCLQRAQLKPEQPHQQPRALRPLEPQSQQQLHGIDVVEQDGDGGKDALQLDSVVSGDDEGVAEEGDEPKQRQRRDREHADQL